MIRDQVLMKKCFVINDKDNGGESLSLTTIYIDNGDDVTTKSDGIYMNQELSLQSYSNSATFNLTSAVFTPEILRELANELDKARNIALSVKVKALNE